MLPAGRVIQAISIALDGRVCTTLGSPDREPGTPGTHTTFPGRRSYTRLNAPAPAHR
ncbi:hypothetical protein SCOCK_250110 [Actinacidiphila cocklensis]|uniref:Uncharacterized protein n=1 Tax=Actinacidiphila cocklensis TaxID=887465 RepID=A0A9W4GRG3_9ACTN|nr:hypothetical protein SCOCK_250110 [Actinacidiphila cocklensis]